MAIETTTKLLTHLAHRETISDVDYTLRRRMCRSYFPMETAAGDVHTGFPVFRPEKACILKGLRIIPGDAVTKHATKYITFTFESEDAAGAGNVAAGTTVSAALTTKTVSWVQGVPQTFSVDDTDTLAVSQALFLVVAKADAGTVTPDCLIEVEYELS